MSIDPFNAIYSDLVSDLHDKNQREKMEDYAVMAGSIVAAESVPGIGEVQMAIQFLDFIDPFGYNQALNRKQVDNLLLGQYQNIQEMQDAIRGCYQNGSADSCQKAGISQTQLDEFKTYPQSVQDKLVKTRTSWLYPTNPIARYSQTFPCMIATDPGFMETNCKDPDYKKLYMDYWNANEASFQADAQAAEKKAAEDAAKGLISNGAEESNTQTLTQMRILFVAIYITLVLLVFFVLRRVLKH